MPYLFICPRTIATSAHLFHTDERVVRAIKMGDDCNFFLSIFITYSASILVGGFIFNSCIFS